MLLGVVLLGGSCVVLIVLLVVDFDCCWQFVIVGMLLVLVCLCQVYVQLSMCWLVFQVDVGVVWQELGLLFGLVVLLDNFIILVKVVLGQCLFNDLQLLCLGQIVCVSCYECDFVFVDGCCVLFGYDCQVGCCNVFSVVMSGYLQWLFWDGCVVMFEDQVLLLIVDLKEMVFSVDVVVVCLCGDVIYCCVFVVVFGNDCIEICQFVQVIVVFECSLVLLFLCLDWFIFGCYDQFDDQQLQGLYLFCMWVCCMNCYSGFVLIDYGFYNLGLYFYGGRCQDLGCYEVIGDLVDSGCFCIFLLCGVVCIVLYMYNGVIVWLDVVLLFYNVGGGKL